MGGDHAAHLAQPNQDDGQQRALHQPEQQPSRQIHLGQQGQLEGHVQGVAGQEPGHLHRQEHDGKQQRAGDPPRQVVGQGVHRGGPVLLLHRVLLHPLPQEGGEALEQPVRLHRGKQLLEGVAGAFVLLPVSVLVGGHRMGSHLLEALGDDRADDVGHRRGELIRHELGGEKGHEHRRQPAQGQHQPLGGPPPREKGQQGHNRNVKQNSHKILLLPRIAGPPNRRYMDGVREYRTPRPPPRSGWRTRPAPAGRSWPPWCP